MRIKVEPSGCCERKGYVRIRYCFYLDKGDAGYDKCHVQVPVIPKEGYQGEMGEMYVPKDQTDYDKWIASLPTVWEDRPFHNHFVYLPHLSTDKQILDTGEKYLKEAYALWSEGKPISIHNEPVEISAVSSQLKASCESRVTSIKSATLERKCLTL